MNPEYQERPKNGASIGAWIGDRHLPAVSFGGLVLIDDKPYGMTVHHMLDNPDQDFHHVDTSRSGAEACEIRDPGLSDKAWEEDDFAHILSDTESEQCSESDLESNYDEGLNDVEGLEPGDVPGVKPGCGDGYLVTQPALDDVDEGFYPCRDRR